MIGSRTILLAFIGIACACGGCGGDGGPPRHKLSGTVEFNGQPVPYGQILFSPDTAQNNSGPGSAAIIRDGKYETFAEKGVVGGPHRVTITGYDKAIDGTVPESDVHELFPTYQTTVDLPREDARQDFPIPTAR